MTPLTKNFLKLHINSPPSNLNTNKYHNYHNNTQTSFNNTNNTTITNNNINNSHSNQTSKNVSSYFNINSNDPQIIHPHQCPNCLKV